MEPIPLFIDTWLQNLLFVLVFVLFFVGAIVGASRVDKGERWGWRIILAGAVSAVGLFLIVNHLLGIPQDERAAAIAETYGVELDGVQLRDIGYTAQTEIAIDARPYLLGTLLVDDIDGTVDVLRIAWDGEEVILTDGDNVELPRR
jgi:hypothetical protein